jgi:protein involved in polysaccharide export with SLBB domain
MANGGVQLPIVGEVRVGGMNLAQASAAITDAYAAGFLKDSRVNVFLLEKRTIGVVVLGAVQKPGIYPLPDFENDVAHALAAAGGLHENAGDVIEVHRRITEPFNGQMPPPNWAGGVPSPGPAARGAPEGVLPAHPPELVPLPPVDSDGCLMGGGIIRIPLRGCQYESVSPASIVLNPGDVVVVPDRVVETFYVVGKLSTNNTIRYSVALPERELGNALVLPPNREIDVVTAVVMAGYIDPIDSPTTVSIQRTGPDGTPFVILVDLIRARYDRRETVLIQPGDIVYLNPDYAWWGRRTFDALIRSIVQIRLTHVF